MNNILRVTFQFQDLLILFSNSKGRTFLINICQICPRLYRPSYKMRAGYPSCLFSSELRLPGDNFISVIIHPLTSNGHADPSNGYLNRKIVNSVLLDPFRRRSCLPPAKMDPLHQITYTIITEKTRP